MKLKHDGNDYDNHMNCVKGKTPDWIYWLMFTKIVKPSAVASGS